LSWRY